MAECWRGDVMRVPWLFCWLLLFTAVQMIDSDTRDKTKTPAPPVDPRSRMKAIVGKKLPKLKGRYEGRIYPTPRETTTRLPEFLPDGPRPFIPDPSFMPGDVDIVVHEGDVASLPCTVQNLGTRQVSWQKVGGEHFLSIGTEIWVQDENLNIDHKSWPAGVGDWDLVFREARLMDSGLYECQVISTEKMAWRVRLTVIEKPPHNPVISIEGKEFVESGQTVYLKCNTTEGDRIPEDVDWFKDGDKIEASEYPNIVITKFRSKDTISLVSELMIVSGTSNDSGTYICRSSSELIASVEVNVLVADSSNVKRGKRLPVNGTGASHTQTGGGQNNGNAAIYFPFFLGNPLIFCVTLLTLFIMNAATT